MAQAVQIGTGVAAGTWMLDQAASRFEFQVTSFWGLITVRGFFRLAEGRVEVDASGSISATVKIDAASVDTGLKPRDKHLRSADYFGVVQQPNVTFSTSRVEVLAADRLLVDGDLTVAGHVVQIAFEARLVQSGNTVTIEARVPVDRTQFGMTHNPLHMVAPTALLVIRAQFNQTGPA